MPWRPVSEPSMARCQQSLGGELWTNCELRLVSIFKENIGLNFRPPRMRLICLSWVYLVSIIEIVFYPCVGLLLFWVELMFVGAGPKNTPLENDLPLWVHVSHWFHCQSCAKQVSTRRFVQLQSFHCLWIISMEYHGCANASWIDDKTLIVDKQNRAFQGNENRMRHLSREWSSLYFAPWRMNFWAFQLQ